MKETEVRTDGRAASHQSGGLVRSRRQTGQDSDRQHICNLNQLRQNNSSASTNVTKTRRTATGRTERRPRKSTWTWMRSTPYASPESYTYCIRNTCRQQYMLIAYTNAQMMRLRHGTTLQPTGFNNTEIFFDRSMFYLRQSRQVDSIVRDVVRLLLRLLID